jgi:glycosyltransferase involved in cell wall biosynthesis
MNIAVDATCWLNRRGYGRHARALLRSLVRCDRRNHYTFFLDGGNPVEPLPREVEVVQVNTEAPTATAAAADGNRSLVDMLQMSRELSNAKFDLVFFPSIYSYVPVFSRARLVVVIHDAIAETYPQLTLPSKKARWFWKAKVSLGRRQADAIVTVSNYSRQMLAVHFHIDPDNIFVAGEAADPVFRLLPDPLPTPHMHSLGISRQDRLVVYVGGFGPHKNLETLVLAFSRLAKMPEFANARLVMVGENRREVFHSSYSKITSLVQVLGLEGRFLFTGFLPDEELVVLLNLASVLALPSFMEGFGLPAVEAAACGCPVVATTASPLPELLGDAGLYVEPENTSGWEAALRQVLASRELREKMRAAGLQAVSRLTWEAAAGQMLDVFKKVGAG